mgnify:FL=1
MIVGLLLSALAQGQDPEISDDPVDQNNACIGTSVDFGILGTDIDSYQWQESQDGGSTFSDLVNNATYFGVQSDTLSVTVAAGLDNYQYRCVVSNGSGKDTSDAAVLTIDAVAPTITCGADVSQTADAGVCEADVTVPAATTDDNCGVASVTNDYNNTADASDTYPVGTTTVTWTVTDDAGNTSTCTQDVTVTDNEDPTVTAAADITANTSGDGTGNCTVEVAVADATFSDNCTSNLTWEMTGEVTDNGTGQVGSYTFPAGVTTITYTNADGAGNTATDALQVKVTDDEAPVVTAGADIAANTSDDGTGNCTVNITIPGATFNDNCQSTLTWEMSGGVNDNGTGQVGKYSFPVGITTITYTNTDGAGNTTTDALNVSVTDDEDPTLTAGADINAATSDDGTGDCLVDVAVPDAVYTDNCFGYLNWSMSGALNNNGSGQIGTFSFPVGVTTITYTSTDVEGNTATDDLVVTVTDDEDPTVTAAADITVGTSDDGTGNCTVEVAVMDAAFSDNCSSNLTWTMSGALTDNGTGQVGNYTFPVGVTTITYTNTDDAGQTATDALTVTVTDNEDPTVTAAGDISAGTSDDGTGNCTAEIAIPDAAFDDNCNSTLTWAMTGAVTDNGTGQVGSYTFPVGTTTITYTNTDDAGQTASDALTVTVTDDEVPVVTAAADITASSSDDGTGNCNTEIAVPDATFGDNCASTLTWEMSGAATADGTGQVSSYVFPVGTTTITYTNTDAEGQTATDELIVTVSDDEDPVVDAASDINAGTSADGAGNCNATLSIPDATYNDNCSSTLIWEMSGTITDNGTGQVGSYTFPVGVTNITYTTTDPANNTSSDVLAVTVTDDESPVVNCPGEQSVTTNSGSRYQVEATEFDINSASDNCLLGDTSYTLSGATNVGETQATTLQGVYFNSGITTVTWKVTDDAGNTATCSFDITVSDTENPTISCVGDQNVNTNNGCSYQVTGDEFDILEASDNSEIVDTTYQLSGATTAAETSARTLQGMVFNLGVTQVIWTVYDDAGNAVSCGFDVTVSDQNNPAVTCISDQNVNTNNLCTYQVSGSAFDITQATDNCGLSDTTYQLSGATTMAETSAQTLDGVRFNTGTTQIIWRVYDDAGNSGSCNFDVTVTDNESPSITAAGDQTVASDDSCKYVVPGTALDIVDAADNCLLTDTTYQITGATSMGETAGTSLAGITFNAGVSTVTWRVYDATGNSAAASTQVEVVDSIDPVITSTHPDQTLSANAGCQTVLPDYRGAVTATDNCDDQLEVFQSPGGGSTLSGPDNTVILSVIDDAGNIANASFNVEVVDHTPPVISSDHPDQTIGNGVNCEVELPNYVPDVEASDNCDANPEIVQDPPAGTMISSGTTQVTLTVTDQAGNQSEALFAVSVKDTIAPTIYSTINDQTLTALGNCEAVLPNYTEGITAGDNCDDNLDITQDPVGGSRISGNNNTITIFVTDDAGNTSELSFNAEVVDRTSPIFSSLIQNQRIAADTSCGATLPNYMTDLYVTDNCDTTLDLTQSPSPGIYISGTYNQVTLTASDDAGNSRQVTFNVSVVDSMAPEFETALQDRVIGDGTACELTLPDFTDQVTGDDNCDSQIEVTQSPTTGTLVSGSNNKVVISLLDDAGNMASDSFLVSVLDNTKPVIHSRHSDQRIGDGTTCQVTLPDYTTDVEATDNCAETLDISQVPEPGTSISGLENAVTLKVSDGAGNISEANFNVEVIDNQSPVIQSAHPDQVVGNGSACQLELPDYRSQLSATDNCDKDLIVSQNPGPGTLISGVDNEVTLSVSDHSGNKDQVSFNVEVFNAAPTITTEPDGQSLAANDSCRAEVPDFRNLLGVFDYCDENLEITQEPSPGTIISKSVDEVLFTVTDDAGNTVQTAISLDVVDTLRPAMRCPEDQIIPLETGESSYMVPDSGLDVMNLSDNCGIDVVTNDFNNSETLMNAELPAGTTTITWQVKDNAGNQGECSFEVTISGDVGFNDNIQHYGIAFYPNPTSGKLNYRFSSVSVDKLIISDLAGKKLIEKQDLSKEGILDLSRIHGGVYIITIQTGQGEFNTRLIKK